MWYKDFNNIYCQDSQMLYDFINKYNVISYNKVGECIPTNIRNTLETGRYYPSFRTNKNKENAIDRSMIDHAYFFKTKNHGLMYVSHPYNDYNELIKYFNESWQEEHGLNVEIYKPNYSWYHENTCMVIFRTRYEN